MGQCFNLHGFLKSNFPNSCISCSSRRLGNIFLLVDEDFLKTVSDNMSCDHYFGLLLDHKNSSPETTIFLWENNILILICMLVNLRLWIKGPAGSTVSKILWVFISFFVRIKKKKCTLHQQLFPLSLGKTILRTMNANLIAYPIS